MVHERIEATAYGTIGTCYHSWLLHYEKHFCKVPVFAKIETGTHFSRILKTGSQKVYFWKPGIGNAKSTKIPSPDNDRFLYR